MIDSYLHLNIPKGEVTDLMFGIVRAIIIFSVVHILTYFIDGSEKLFNEEILKQILYTIVALIIYHLFVKQILSSYIKKKEDK